MTTQHLTCLPYAVLGGVCAGCAWMPASPLRPSPRRSAGHPICLGNAGGARFGRVPH